MKKYRATLSLIFGSWGIFFFFLWPRMLFSNPSGIYAGWKNVWADWSAHMTYANVFAEKAPADWFTHHPLFIEERFSYPFLVNLISGLMMKVGIDRVSAFLIPSFFCSILFFVALGVFFQNRLKSPGKSLIATSLFLASGGLGFVVWLKSKYANGEISVYECTNIDALRIKFMNVITSEFLPQRAFFLGLPLALFTLNLVLKWHEKNFKGVSSTKLIFAGIFTGFLVIVHAHSVMALGFIFLTMIALKPKPFIPWLKFGASAFVIAVCLYFNFLRAKNAQGFFAIRIGWMSDPGLGGVLRFWWLNWGLFLPLALFSAWKPQGFRDPLVLSAIVMFIFCNIFRISPWDWDNMKILTWVYLLLSIPIAEYLGDLWTEKKHKMLMRSASIFLFLLCTLSGFHDLSLLIDSKKNTAILWSTEDLQAAEDFKKISAPTDVVLISPLDVTHWIARLTGRQIVMGYTGSVWSYGFDYLPTEANIRKIYTASEDAEALLQKYNIRFVSIGPSELKDYSANESFFAQKFERVLSNSRYRVYRVGAE